MRNDPDNDAERSQEIQNRQAAQAVFKSNNFHIVIILKVKIQYLSRTYSIPKSGVQ